MSRFRLIASAPVHFSVSDTEETFEKHVLDGQRKKKKLVKMAPPKVFCSQLE